MVRDHEVPGSSPGAPRRLPALLLLVATGAVPCSAAPRQPVPVREFAGLSQPGPTGLILVPTGSALRSGAFAIGLHRGVAKAAAGWLGFEAGVRTPDLYEDPNSDDWNDATVLFSKLAVTELLRRIAGGGPESRWLPDIGVGAEDSVRHAFTAPLDLGRARTAADQSDPQTFYAVVSWSVVLGGWPVEAVAGAGTGRFEGRAFGGLSVIPTTFFGNTLKVVGEYAGRGADIGARVALARNLRLDFAMLLHASPEPGARGRHWNVTLDRGLVGASQAGRIRLDWLWAKPAPGPAKT